MSPPVAVALVLPLPSPESVLFPPFAVKLKDAIEDGMEYFLWTPAKIQIDRWSGAIRKNIDRFDYYRPMLVENDSYPAYTRLINKEIANARTPEERAKVLHEIPLRRHAVAEDISGVVAFFASDDAGFITGATLDVNGGQGMA